MVGDIYELQRTTRFGLSNKKSKLCKNQIVFVGSSLMESFPIENFISESQENIMVYNIGINGTIAEELYKDIKNVF